MALGSSGIVGGRLDVRTFLTGLPEELSLVAARDAHEAAGRRLERLLSERPDDPRLHAAFGIARAGIGHFDEAGRAGRRAVELLPVEREAWRGVVLLEDLAEIHMRAGQHDAAIEIIERLLRLPGPITEPALRGDPRWAPLRNHPQFLTRVSEHVP